MRIYQRTNITKFPLRLCRVEGGGFLFPFIFLCAYHNLRLFYALAELVRRESVLGARKVRNLLTTRFLREITSHFRRRKIFHETDLSARFCKSVDSENTYATENRFIRHHPAQTKRKEEKIIGARVSYRII